MGELGTVGSAWPWPFVVAGRIQVDRMEATSLAPLELAKESPSAPVSSGSLVELLLGCKEVVGVLAVGGSSRHRLE